MGFALCSAVFEAKTATGPCASGRSRLALSRLSPSGSYDGSTQVRPSSFTPRLRPLSSGLQELCFLLPLFILGGTRPHRAPCFLRLPVSFKQVRIESKDSSFRNLDTRETVHSQSNLALGFVLLRAPPGLLHLSAIFFILCNIKTEKYPSHGFSKTLLPINSDKRGVAQHAFRRVTSQKGSCTNISAYLKQKSPAGKPWQPTCLTGRAKGPQERLLVPQRGQNSLLSGSGQMRAPFCQNVHINGKLV